MVMPELGSFKSIGGGCSCDAIMGAASAKGEEMEEGVDERVWWVLTGCQYIGTGTADTDGRLEGLIAATDALSRLVSRPELKGMGDADATGVGSAEDC